MGDKPPPLEDPVSLRSLAQDDTRHGDNTTGAIPDVSFDLTNQYERPTPVVDQSLSDNDLDSGILPGDGVVRCGETDTGNTGSARCETRRSNVQRPFNIFTSGVGGHVHPADHGATRKVKIAKKEVA
ncbi:hypothetical protein DPMN_169034 [Dreissena polymorpha]|uniref:Uncharacterized protein n=1 Tax=Dreissena polymorpha TaxID=45954 RepID=A0A9D4F6A4_DREPO|nr:hypothetical protein DPMN_169034 [Dreissena polymorpha]